MKILRIKQTIKNKNVRHRKYVQSILTLSFLLFIATGITGCTKEYTADDIKAYAKDTLSIRRVSVDQTPQEYKDEDGYTDILWTVKDKKNNINLTNAEIVADYTNQTELRACLSALQDVYTFYKEKGFDDLTIGYTLHYQQLENSMDTEGKDYSGILSDVPTISEFK